MYKGNPDIEVIWLGIYLGAKFHGAPRCTSRIQLPVGNHRPLRLSIEEGRHE